MSYSSDEPDGSEPRGMGRTGLAEVLQFGRPTSVAIDNRQAHLEEWDLYLDMLAEYSWARDAAGVSGPSIQVLTNRIDAFVQHFREPPWRITHQMADNYFANEVAWGRSTSRKAMGQIAKFYRFIEIRYADEIKKRFDVDVRSPIDEFNMPVHSGDFLIVRPPARQELTQYFGSWKDDLEEARKYAIAARDYAMARVTYATGLRAAELCNVKMRDLAWDMGEWGRVFVSEGKGSKGSGPRQRWAFMFEEGRAILEWYVENVRGHFSDDPARPEAPLFPSERSLSVYGDPQASRIQPAAFRRQLNKADKYLPGPVEHIYPHLLRHACATHMYESGFTIWEVQTVLGHRFPTTTVRYVSTAFSDPGSLAIDSANRASARLNIRNGKIR